MQGRQTDFYSLTDVSLLHCDNFPVEGGLTFIYFLSLRSEQPGHSGAGGKSAERGECGSSGLRSPQPALLPPNGQKPLPHHTTGPPHVITGMKQYCYIPPNIYLFAPHTNIPEFLHKSPGHSTIANCYVGVIVLPMQSSMVPLLPTLY